MPPKKAIIAGMDEAGRGSWAGPVVAAAVIIQPGQKFPGLTDSKLLSAGEREVLYKLITSKCDYGLGVVGHETVDEWGLLHATFLAFKMALDSLRTRPNKLLIDGRDRFKFDVPHESIIRGDIKIKSISAASVLAKVTRDKIMVEYASRYPEYGFDKHKGYGTKRHLDALKSQGPCAIHRLTYGPIQNIKCEQTTFL